MAKFLVCFALIASAQAFLNISESSARLTLANDRLVASVEKASGAIDLLTLDGQNLLGVRNGSTGLGPYLDCYCIPSGAYTPGRIAPKYKSLGGTDSNGVAWGGIVMSETYPLTGQVLEQYWFLRQGETGLHTFSRLAYRNESTPFLRNLQEFRTLFRPNARLWTHLSTNEEQFAPLPYHNPATGDLGNAVVVQDATW
jgi:rhamnogalacturonan endolyase